MEVVLGFAKKMFGLEDERGVGVGVGGKGGDGGEHGRVGSSR